LKEFQSFPSIAILRELVAGAIGEEQLAFYQMQEENSNSESVDEGSNYRLKDKPVSTSREKRNIKTRQVTAIRTVDELKRFILRLGSEYGAQYTLW
jgi:hypothetical protein